MKHTISHPDCCVLGPGRHQHIRIIRRADYARRKTRFEKYCALCHYCNTRLLGPLFPCFNYIDIFFMIICIIYEYIFIYFFFNKYIVFEFII